MSDMEVISPLLDGTVRPDGVLSRDYGAIGMTAAGYEATGLAMYRGHEDVVPPDRLEEPVYDGGLPSIIIDIGSGQEVTGTEVARREPRTQSYILPLSPQPVGRTAYTEGAVKIAFGFDRDLETVESDLKAALADPDSDEEGLFIQFADLEGEELDKRIRAEAKMRFAESLVVGSKELSLAAITGWVKRRRMKFENEMKPIKDRAKRLSIITLSAALGLIVANDCIDDEIWSKGDMGVVKLAGLSAAVIMARRYFKLKPLKREAELFDRTQLDTYASLVASDISSIFIEPHRDQSQSRLPY